MRHRVVFHEEAREGGTWKNIHCHSTLQLFSQHPSCWQAPPPPPPDFFLLSKRRKEIKTGRHPVRIPFLKQRIICGEMKGKKIQGKKARKKNSPRRFQRCAFLKDLQKKNSYGIASGGGGVLARHPPTLFPSEKAPRQPLPRQTYALSTGLVDKRFTSSGSLQASAQTSGIHM